MDRDREPSENKIDTQKMAKRIAKDYKPTWKTQIKMLQEADVQILKVIDQAKEANQKAEKANDEAKKAKQEAKEANQKAEKANEKAKKAEQKVAEASQKIKNLERTINALDNKNSQLKSTTLSKLNDSKEKLSQLLYENDQKISEAAIETMKLKLQLGVKGSALQQVSQENNDLKDVIRNLEVRFPLFKIQQEEEAEARVKAVQQFYQVEISKMIKVADQEKNAKVNQYLSLLAKHEQTSKEGQQLFLQNGNLQKGIDELQKKLNQAETVLKDTHLELSTQKSQIMYQEKQLTAAKDAAISHENSHSLLRQEVQSLRKENQRLKKENEANKKIQERNGDLQRRLKESSGTNAESQEKVNELQAENALLKERIKALEALESSKKVGVDNEEEKVKLKISPVLAEEKNNHKLPAAVLSTDDSDTTITIIPSDPFRLDESLLTYNPTNLLKSKDQLLTRSLSVNVSVKLVRPVEPQTPEPPTQQKISENDTLKIQQIPEPAQQKIAKTNKIKNKNDKSIKLDTEIKKIEKEKKQEVMPTSRADVIKTSLDSYYNAQYLDAKNLVQLKNYEKAVKAFNKISSVNPLARFALAKLAQSKNPRKAFREYKELAKENPQSGFFKFQLARCYANGIGVEENIDKANEYYELAKDEVPMAAYQLALYYNKAENSNANKESLEKVKSYFQLAKDLQAKQALAYFTMLEKLDSSQTITVKTEIERIEGSLKELEKDEVADAKRKQEKLGAERQLTQVKKKDKSRGMGGRNWKKNEERYVDLLPSFDPFSKNIGQEMLLRKQKKQEKTALPEFPGFAPPPPLPRKRGRGRNMEVAQGSNPGNSGRAEKTGYELYRDGMTCLDSLDRGDGNKAFKYFSQAVKKDYAPANYCLGACYEAGFGTTQDTEQAQKCYRLAFESHSSLAAYYLSSKSNNMKAATSAVYLACFCLFRKIEATLHDNPNDLYATNYISDIHKKTDNRLNFFKVKWGFDIDYLTQLMDSYYQDYEAQNQRWRETKFDETWVDNTAQLLEAQSRVNTAESKQSGPTNDKSKNDSNREKNKENSVDLFPPLEPGDMGQKMPNDTQKALGRSYEKLTKQKKQVRKGYAQYQIGMLFLGGESGEALNSFTKAVDEGYGPAYYRLGDCYEQGIGMLQKNKAQALECYHQGFKSHSSLAAFSLGLESYITSTAKSAVYFACSRLFRKIEATLQDNPNKMENAIYISDIHKKTDNMLDSFKVELDFDIDYLTELMDSYYQDYEKQNQRWRETKFDKTWVDKTAQLLATRPRVNTAESKQSKPTLKVIEISRIGDAKNSDNRFRLFTLGLGQRLTGEESLTGEELRKLLTTTDTESKEKSAATDTTSNATSKPGGLI